MKGIYIMKKLFSLMSLCMFILFAGCSLKEADSSIPKKIDLKQSTVTQTDEKMSLTQAFVNFYGDTSEPIIVYQQIPFKDGTLVLAEKVMDGEHYPDLHFVDINKKVTYLTRGSYCWTLNYTQFRGYYIFFGLAGVEVRHYGQNSSPVEKVEAVFDDKTESVIPAKEIVTLINPKEKDTRIFKNPQGYIMPVKGQKMPDNLIATLEGGDKVSLSQKSIEWQSGYMPDYLKVKKADVYNSFAFTFTPMLTPVEWEQGHMDGEICLKGKTDENGNLNALWLRPSGHMKQIESFILPQDIKPFYLSNNYPRLAKFAAGETVKIVYPEQRRLLDCHILRLTKLTVEKELGQDSLTTISADEKNHILLPKEKGYYLFVLRTEKEIEIQTYTGVLKID